MKNTKLMVGVVLLGGLFLGTTEALGEIIGRSYAEADYNYVKLGEAPSGVDDNIDMFGLGLRLGGKEHMDAVAEFSVGSWEGSDIWQASAGLQPYWKPEDGFYTVFADLRIVYGEIEDDALGSSESDTGFSAGIGSELSATDSLSFIGQVEYIDVLDSDDIEVSGSINFWVTDWLLFNAGLGYAVDSEDVTANLGIGLGF